jgi:MYXO-CTERM domain-containing protein
VCLPNVSKMDSAGDAADTEGDRPNPEAQGSCALPSKPLAGLAPLVLLGLWLWRRRRR